MCYELIERKYKGMKNQKIIKALQAFANRVPEINKQCNRLVFDTNTNKYYFVNQHLIARFDLTVFDSEFNFKKSLACEDSYIKDYSRFFKEYDESVLKDNRVLLDKIRLLEHNPRQFDQEKSWYRYIDFDKNSHEFAIAHKNTKQKGYIRVNSNYIKTALRIISLLGDNAIFIHFNTNDNSTLSIQSKSVCFEIAGVWY